MFRPALCLFLPAPHAAAILKRQRYAVSQLNSGVFVLNAFCISCTSNPSTGPVSGSSGNGNIEGGFTAVAGDTTVASSVSMANALAGVAGSK